MDLFITWENDANHLVDDIEWIQTHCTDWAYSLTRHMNAACRIANLIGAESLSMAYLVNYMRMTSGLSDTLGLSSFDPVRLFLMLEGMVLDDDYRMLFAQFMRIPELPLPNFFLMITQICMLCSLLEEAFIKEFLLSGFETVLG
ncbi:unnamed protein product [Brassica napus]|uniref:(rape) hypothetical protein n=1 Tax=Brassica napus TaxID=3708 RepID=A0A816HV56_BRANA|nr:unnamed protein product [Brassica napus]